MDTRPSHASGATGTGNRSNRFSYLCKTALLGSTVLVSATGLVLAAERAQAQQADPSAQPTVSSTTARAGEVTGVISDVNTGALLQGAKVRVVQTGQTTATDERGQFRFVGLQPGDYTLRVSYIGFPTENIGVRVEAGRGVFQEVALGVTMEELIVTARRSAEASALNKQRTSDLISNVISADALGRFPDATVAESLNRLPGVSFERENRSGDGQFISIRGLDSALNNVQINGVNSAQANADGDRRIPLDVFSAESISRVTVNKSLLPNNESDGIGGTVELETATPLEIGKNQYRFSAEGRIQEVNDSPGWRVGGTISRIFGSEENFGVLVSGSFRRRNRVAFEIEDQLTQGGVPAPLFVPADLGIVGGEEFDGIPPGLGTPSTFPATLTGLQYSFFDDQRDDLTLSGVIDWQVSDNTKFSLFASYNEEKVESVRSTTRITTGESDDEDGDPDDDILPLVADGVTVDLADIFPEASVPLTPGSFIARGGDEIFAVAEPEILFRAESEPEENTNFTLSFQGETFADRWTFKYQLGYARAEDGFARGPRPQIDFEPEDLDDEDYQERLDDLGLTGIGLLDIFPGGPVLEEFDAGTGTGVLAPGSANGDIEDVTGFDGRFFWLLNGLSSNAPQFANVDPAALQAAILAQQIFFIDDITLDLERGEQDRYSAKFDVTYEPPQDWIDFLAAGFKFERADRESVNLEVFDIDDDEFLDALEAAGVTFDVDGDGEDTLADATALNGIVADNNIDLNVFNGVAPFEILRATRSGIDAFEELTILALNTLAAAGGGDLGGSFDEIELPDDFDFTTDDPFDFIPVEEVRENFYTGYLMGKFNFGKLDVVGGVRLEYGSVRTRSTQRVSFELVDQDAAGNFLGEVDADGDPLDGSTVALTADDTVFLVNPDGSLGGSLGQLGDLSDGFIDFDTTSFVNIDLLETNTDFFEVLPRFQANYRATDNLIFRGAFWTAIARPSFQDITSAGTVDFEQSSSNPRDASVDIDFGNPDLDNAYSYNFDLGAEYYFGNVGVISLNLFYKIIDDFVFVDETPSFNTDVDSLPSVLQELLQQSTPEGQDLDTLLSLVGALDFVQPQGGVDARIFGLEFAVQRRLDFLPGFLDGFGIFANVTVQDTKADLPVVLDDDTIAIFEVPFFNAPDIVSTMSLYYDKYGIDAALTYQIQDEQLVDFGSPFTGPKFEQEFDQLDFNVKYTLPISYPDVVLSFGINDLLNGGADSVSTETFGSQGNVLFSESEFIGRTFTFGASVRF